ncbi:transforming growth factor-beta-induced protein ig-h3-like [Paramacrobiotus metropolitanus]|uniref:transforming growth factor-beta-induced protein ig-h3-like n=1 Tax=Paramacrobiotus metropolitanus TaxID=2943436 RepID=UPI00244569CE|nr:transforming growth factor-beta-induced protein ig-h3-like [Paramacrobiotus metropolitanus]
MYTFIPIIAVLCGLSAANLQLDCRYDPRTGRPRYADSKHNVLEMATCMGHTSYLEALEETGSLHILLNKGITAWIPTNDAFAKISTATRDFWHHHKSYYKNLMKYHVIKGRYNVQDLVNDVESYDTYAEPCGTRARYVNFDGFSKNISVYMGAVINSTNHQGSNGVIHILDDVVKLMMNETILKVIQKHSQFSKVLEAVKSVDLNDRLSADDPPRTFLAPSDDAISKLPDGAWEKLVSNPAALTEVLLYHISPLGSWYSAGLAVDGMSVPTLSKKGNWTIRVTDDGIQVDKGNLVITDLPATNGVVHSIDTVLMPKSVRKWLYY